MVDIAQRLVELSEALISRAKILPQIQLDWQPPLYIRCREIAAYKYGVDEAVIQCIEEKRDLPALYYFKLVNGADRERIVKKLKEFKDTRTHSCPKIDKRGFDSDYLYCGSIRKNLHGRLIQHLGKGHRLTYSLQLAHWSFDLDFALEYHFAWIDKQYIGFTEMLESALTKQLAPLVGRSVG